MTGNRLVPCIAKRDRSLVLAAYALLTAAMTWPVVARVNTHVPGGTVDLWTHRWTYWWIKHAIAEGRHLFHTDLLFYPQGVSLAFHNVAWVNIAVWLPLQAMVGGDAAYSLTFLIFCTLNGFAMYLLVRELGGSQVAAFIGGLIYGFWPYTLSQFGHPNMKVTCWVPLALLFLRRTLHEQRTKDAVMAGVFVALTGLTRWQLLFMAGVPFILFLAWEFLRGRGHWNTRCFALLALTGFVAGALMAPLAMPVASAFLTRDDASDVLFTEEVSGQTDLLAYVLPTPYHPFWNARAEQLYENFTHNRIFVPFLGYTALGLALYGTVRRWRKARFWLLVAGVFVALALGPELRVNGQLYPNVPMPYRLIGDLSLVRAVRVPNRFNLFLGLPVAVLVALGVEALTHRSARRASIMLTVALTGLILREYSLVPYHTERPITPDWYGRLGRDPDRFAVLDLPIGLQTFNKRYMFYQIKHRKPLVEGKVARPPREAFAFLESSSFLSQLHERNVMDPDLVNVSSQLSILADADVRYVVIHKAFASKEQILAWRDWLTFEPMHEDDDVVVYRTDPHYDRDFAFSHVLTEQVGLVRASFSSVRTIQGATVRLDARWGSSGVPGKDYEVCFSLLDSAGRSTKLQCTPLAPSWPTSQWEADEVVRSSYALGLPLSLDPGDYSLRLTLTDTLAGSTVGWPADLGSLQVVPLQPAHARESAFGDVFGLLGYDLVESPDGLSVTLYWRALRETGVSYKMFVHLTDPDSGDIVAQVDTIPRDWTYPTNRWIHGEVVEDTVSLSLEGVGPGQYALTVGWYDPATGQRLPALTPEGMRHSGDAVLMMSLEVD